MHPLLVIHGGAASWDPLQLSGSRAGRYRQGLQRALDLAWQRLLDGAGALEAVATAVTCLEADGVFNAGRGAVRNRDGVQELDAAVMDGATGRAGAVAAVTRLRHPVRLAWRVLERSSHVLLVGRGAEAFAVEQGMALDGPWPEQTGEDGPYGTVGAVARDAHGRLAAATSTGGIRGKLPGRVGDSPLIGSGTWADARVAVSCTGDGEAFIRSAAAHDLAARLAYGGQDPAAAARAVLTAVRRQGGLGGLIAVTADGAILTPHSSPALLHGWRSVDGERVGLHDGI